MAFKIYTKTGDKGLTSLIGGTRVSKHHIRIESYGTIDELNSYIGLVKDQVNDSSLISALLEIQDRLFTIGASLASDPEKSKMKLPDIVEQDILFLESEIDRMQNQLPELKSFILPGGHTTVSYGHIARCVCRRAERITSMLAENSFVAPFVIPYLNRLSDYLFVLSRFLCYQLNVAETVWKPRI
ncbi:MAG: cob(I)yrinic acid a,c-diamide adenosyltransferase [Bacteroidetes bacterium]|nr:cob(I)yrinic acid a,c-diamide adenosyltransferase [Bacteroidota bacterium]